jgi:hypothetical protein
MIALMGAGRPPLAQSLVTRCETLLEQGLAQCRIAELLGISRASVHNIKYAGEGLDGEEHAVELGPGERLLARAVRCEGCGGKIRQLPCPACRALTECSATPADRCDDVAIRPASTPTRALPGTAEKIEVMRRRVAAGEAALHPLDAR